MVAALRAALPADHDVIGVGLGVPGIVHDGTVTHAVNLGLDHVPLDLAGHVSERIDAMLPSRSRTTSRRQRSVDWPGCRSRARPSTTSPCSTSAPDSPPDSCSTGRLRHGSRGMAGEIGHLVHDPQGPLCPCGRRGCLELFASGQRTAPAVGRYGRRAVRRRGDRQCRRRAHPRPADGRHRQGDQPARVRTRRVVRPGHRRRRLGDAGAARSDPRRPAPRRRHLARPARRDRRPRQVAAVGLPGRRTRGSAAGKGTPAWRS